MSAVVLQLPDVAPLESGDRLPQKEFHRRYAAMLRLNKAELIEGIVYMPSPVSSLHAKAHQSIVTWLGAFVAGTSGVEAFDNATVILDAENELQPDACLRFLPERGGRSRINDEGYIEGPPEFVAEIALSNASIDLREKKTAYLRAGVREYLVWLVLDRQIHWWQSVGDRFEPLSRDADGVIQSRLFPELALNVPALLAGDLKAVLGAKG